MNGVHDLGGTDGLGLVPVEKDEPVWHADWEKAAFGMFSMPFGAAVGVYGIWFATSEVGKRYFEGIPDAEPVYMNPPPAQTYAQAYTPENEPYKWR